MTLKLNKVKLALILFVLSVGCASTTKHFEANKNVNADKGKAFKFLNETIKPLPKAQISSSEEIDWPVCTLPWNRYNLPVIAPDGLHATVQLGENPPENLIVGTTNNPLEGTIISIHQLDPIHGKQHAGKHISMSGLLLTKAANDRGVLVERPLGSSGRWIGFADYQTGQIEWLISDENINAFPALSLSGNIAWSRRTIENNRFHLVVNTSSKQVIIDDGESDWLFPLFLGNDKVRAYKIKNNALSIVEFDINASKPELTAVSIPLLDDDATRKNTWQLATTNPYTTGQKKHAFYSPTQSRMYLWMPGQLNETASFLLNSMAAAPVQDGSWIVSMKNRVVRQRPNEDDGVHIRNQLAIPVATMSNKWTHYMLIPDGPRLQVRAISLSN